MKNLSLSLLRYLCGFMLCTAPFAVSAQNGDNETEIQPIEKIDEETPDDDKYINAGDRSLTEEELEEAFTVAEEEPSDEEKDEDVSAIKRALAAISSNANDQLKTTASVCSGMQALKKAASTVYITTHPGAFLWPLAISPYGDRIELGDGSVWSVRSTDAYAVLNWYSTDIIVVTPNHEWFSTYAYRLNNQNTGVSVAVNLKLFLSPVFHTIFNHRVVSFDDYSRSIWLEDGSVWSVYPDDYSMKWALGDTVIIGVNDGWFSSTRPNILLNANLLHSVRATCLN